MTILKSLVDSSGWLEATWVKHTQRQDTPGPVTEETTENTIPVGIAEVQVWCQSYHPTQIADLRAKAAEYGTPLDEYEAMLADWVAAYVPPAPLPEPVPQQVTMRQARLELLARDLLDDVEAVIAAAGRAAQIEWEYASLVERSNPVIAVVQQQQGFTDAQIDDLFREAAKR